MSRPNVVIIVADDLGPLTIAPTSPLPLPNLRALHDESLVFEDAHAPAALCAPGRYALMTGNLPLRSRTGGGEWGWPAPSALRPGQRSIAQLLRDGGGYHTQFGGKWHLGGDPIDTGFDGALFVAKGHNFPPYATLLRGVGIRRPPECSTNDGDGSKDSPATSAWRAALPNCLAARARHVLRSAPLPFLYYHSASQKHGPYEAGVGMTQLGTVANASGFGPRFDAVVSLDLAVGTVLDALNARSITESTVLVLTSDHGQDCEWQHVSNRKVVCPSALSTDRTRSFDAFAGMRGYKGTFFEGGLRVPLWVRWPGRIPARVSRATTATIDYVRTLLSMLRVEVLSTDAVDSVDLSQEWSSHSSLAQSARNVFVANGPAGITVRVDQLKAHFRLFSPGCQWNQTTPFVRGCFRALSLIDLSVDPLERDNKLATLPGAAQCIRNVLLSTTNSASPPSRADYDCTH